MRSARCQAARQRRRWRAARSCSTRTSRPAANASAAPAPRLGCLAQPLLGHHCVLMVAQHRLHLGDGRCVRGRGRDDARSGLRGVAGPLGEDADAVELLVRRLPVQLGHPLLQVLPRRRRQLGQDPASGLIGVDDQGGRERQVDEAWVSAMYRSLSRASCSAARWGSRSAASRLQQELPASRSKPSSSSSTTSARRSPSTSASRTSPSSWPSHRSSSSTGAPHRRRAGDGRCAGRCAAGGWRPGPGAPPRRRHRAGRRDRGGADGERTEATASLEGGQRRGILAHARDIGVGRSEGPRSQRPGQLRDVVRLARAGRAQDLHHGLDDTVGRTAAPPRPRSP